MSVFLPLDGGSRLYCGVCVRMSPAPSCLRTLLCACTHVSVLSAVVAVHVCMYRLSPALPLMHVWKSVAPQIWR